MPDLAALDRDLVAGGDRYTEEGEGEVGEDRRRFLPMDREPVFEYVFERITPPLRFRFRGGVDVGEDWGVLPFFFLGQDW